MPNPQFSISKLLYNLFLFVLFSLIFIQPAWAVESQPQRTVLTLELLQERIASPIVNEGSLTVDLREMEIDLQPENKEFRDNFYKLLQDELQKNGTKPV